MACFARRGCVFGGIGTFTTCGCGIDLGNMNCNQNCCQQCCNCCDCQTRCERTSGCGEARGCDNDRMQSGCDRCD